MNRPFGKLARRCVGRGSVFGMLAVMINLSGCRERPEAALLRVDRLVAGTMGIPACDSTADVPASWPRFAFAGGEFEISLPAGTVADSAPGDQWTAPGRIWIGAFVLPEALVRATARADEFRDSEWAKRWCVARTDLGASTVHVWEGDNHPAGIGAWGAALWYFPNTRELAVRVKAPVGTDLAIHRTILASVRRIPRTP